jgi:CBS domain-containing protein
MALVDVIDPFVKRRSWPGRAPESADERDTGDLSPSSVGRYANAAWVAAAPGLEALGVRNLLDRRDTQHAMVFERGDLIGVLCACDLALASPRTRIFEVMSRRVITIESCATVWMAAKIMAQTGVGCLPVSEGGRIVGMIDRDRLLDAGVPLESSGPICGACGSHRHVPFRALNRPRLCVDCYDRAVLDDVSWIETGVGD